MIDYNDAEDILHKALYKWGEELQADVAIEEFSELIQKLIQFKRGRVSETEVLEEIVDSYIMLQQLKIIFDHYKENEPDFDEFFERKMLRLENRINDL